VFPHRTSESCFDDGDACAKRRRNSNAHIVRNFRMIRRTRTASRTAIRIGWSA
jgi:hypothetical protein